MIVMAVALHSHKMGIHSFLVSLLITVLAGLRCDSQWLDEEAFELLLYHCYLTVARRPVIKFALFPERARRSCASCIPQYLHIFWIEGDPVSIIAITLLILCRMVTRFYLLSFFCLVGSSSDSVVWLHDSVFSLFSALLHPPPTLNLLSFCLLLFSSLTVRGPKAPHYALNYSPRQTFCPTTFPCANLLENRRIIQSIAVLDSCIMI